MYYNCIFFYSRRHKLGQKISQRPGPGMGNLMAELGGKLASRRRFMASEVGNNGSK